MRDERGDEDTGMESVEVGGGREVCGIKTKGEPKERQMEVVDWRELDTGREEGQKRGGGQKY